MPWSGIPCCIGIPYLYSKALRPTVRQSGYKTPITKKQRVARPKMPVLKNSSRTFMHTTALQSTAWGGISLIWKSTTPVGSHVSCRGLNVSCPMYWYKNRIRSCTTPTYLAQKSWEQTTRSGTPETNNPVTSRSASIASPHAQNIDLYRNKTFLFTPL